VEGRVLYVVSELWDVVTASVGSVVIGVVEKGEETSVDEVITVAASVVEVKGGDSVEVMKIFAVVVPREVSSLVTSEINWSGAVVPDVTVVWEVVIELSVERGPEEGDCSSFSSVVAKLDDSVDSEVDSSVTE
jgi:hypothetical protein